MLNANIFNVNIFGFQVFGYFGFVGINIAHEYISHHLRISSIFISIFLSHLGFAAIEIYMFDCRDSFKFYLKQFSSKFIANSFKNLQLYISK